MTGDYLKVIVDLDKIAEGFSQLGAELSSVNLNKDDKAQLRVKLSELGDILVKMKMDLQKNQGQSLEV